MKTIAIVVVACKFLVVAPFILYGLLIWVLGFGPDGPKGPFSFDTSTNIAGLCLLLGALAAAYPFSLIKLRGWANWIILATSALPVVFGVFMALTQGWPSDRDILVLTGVSCIYFPIVAALDFILSRKLIAMDERKRTETVQ